MFDFIYLWYVCIWSISNIYHPHLNWRIWSQAPSMTSTTEGALRTRREIQIRLHSLCDRCPSGDMPRDVIFHSILLATRFKVPVNQKKRLFIVTVVTRRGSRQRAQTVQDNIACIRRGQQPRRRKFLTQENHIRGEKGVWVVKRRVSPTTTFM